MWCDKYLYIWHSFRLRCGTSNEKTMVAASPLFRKILTGVNKFNLWTPYSTRLEGRTIHVPYLLADSIYTKWAILVKPIHVPTCDAESKLTTRQNAVGEDMEGCFGVFQSLFMVLRLESYWLGIDDIVTTSEVCVILRNLLIRMTQNGLCQLD